jgi:hypothetical protein
MMEGRRLGRSAKRADVRYNYSDDEEQEESAYEHESESESEEESAYEVEEDESEDEGGKDKPGPEGEEDESESEGESQEEKDAAEFRKIAARQSRLRAQMARDMVSSSADVHKILRDASRAVMRNKFIVPSVLQPTITPTSKENGSGLESRVEVETRDHIRKALVKTLANLPYHGRWTSILADPDFHAYACAKIPEFVFSTTRCLEQKVPAVIARHIASFVDPLCHEQILGLSTHLVCELTKKLPKAAKAPVTRYTRRGDGSHVRAIWTTTGQKHVNRACQYGSHCIDCTHKLLRIQVDGTKIICHRYSSSERTEDLAVLVRDAKSKLDQFKPGMWESLLGKTAGRDVWTYLPPKVPGTKAYLVNVPLIAAEELYKKEPYLRRWDTGVTFSLCSPENTKTVVDKFTLYAVPHSGPRVAEFAYLPYDMCTTPRTIGRVLVSIKDQNKRLQRYIQQLSTVKGMILFVRDMSKPAYRGSFHPACSRVPDVKAYLKKLVRGGAGVDPIVREAIALTKKEQPARLTLLAQVAWTNDLDALCKWTKRIMGLNDNDLLSAIEVVCAGNYTHKRDFVHPTKFIQICSHSGRNTPLLSANVVWCAGKGAAKILKPITERFEAIKQQREEPVSKKTRKA